MKLGKLPSLPFRSRKSQERDDYVRDSLSSLAVSSRLACPSSSRDLKTDPFPLTFHTEWRHASCKVMEWYNRIAPSTQIASIEHRKTLEAPFFHEFLLIHLTDGAVCRLERMGDGSRVDAVRWLGCTAHDIVQWFPAKQYAATPLGQQPCEIVIHVQFPRTFDLLDVLAICYSIKQHRRVSIYTLQRYNCYFVCNTIFTILTRRVAEWETTLITPETWPKLVDDMLEELPRKKHDGAFDYCGIGVCSLLEPDCPNLVNEVVELLRPELKSGAERSVAMGIADTLWYKDVQSSILASLSDHVDTAANKASSSGNGGEVGLKTVLGRGNDELYPDTELRDPVVQRTLIKLLISASANQFGQHLLDLYRVYKMKQIERGGGSSRSIKLLASAIGPLIFWWTFYMDVERGIPGMGETLDMHTRAQFELARISLALSGAGKLAGLSVLDADFSTELGQTTEQMTHAHVLVYYELCRLPVIDTRSKALSLLHSQLKRNQWAYSLRYCLTRLLMEALSGFAGSGVIKIVEPVQSDWSVTDMHDHVHRRIHDHARRVEGYQLAASQLVEEDIERGMSEIWKSLPDGFGGLKPKRPTTRAHRSTRRNPRTSRQTQV